jgi:hypothetical protein
MNEPCTVETGLLRKKPCGHASIAKCATCERPLCMQHAVAQLSAAQKKTGAFMCKECDDARRQYDKEEAKHAKEKREADMMKGFANPGAPKKPASPAPAPAPAAAAPQGKAAPPAAASEPIPDTIEYRPEPKKK